MTRIDLIEQVSRTRLAADLWQLVQTPSPTLQEAAVADVFAALLAGAGATVHVAREIPESPSVIGRLSGGRPGPVLQLAGHLDHIDVPHAPPGRQGDRIYGRGAADMKNGLAGIIEIVRVLHAHRADWAGEILVTAYGRHEAPQGDSAGLLWLIGQGITGDAALVCEGPTDALITASLGMAIWDVTLHGPHRACHETLSPDRGATLLTAVAALAEALRTENVRIAATPPHPLLGTGSVFVGQVHYGDFYNRAPAAAHLQGTRRWTAASDYDQIRRDFETTLAAVLPSGVTAETVWTLVGDACEISLDEPIVRAQAGALQAITGVVPAPRGHTSVTDVCRLVRQGHVPAVLCGFGTDTGHADVEYVDLETVERACRLALLTVLNYQALMTAAAPATAAGGQA